VPVPHIPTPLEQLGQRPFSFYPAIVHIEHNEWILRSAHPDEIQVMNTRGGQDLWIPRRFLSGVSSIEEPVVIVGLIKELEYKQGVVAPHIRRVIEMPRAVNGSPRVAFGPPEPGHLAPVVGIRVETGTESRTGKRVLGVIAAGLLVSFVGLVVLRDGPSGARMRFSAPARISLPFTASDDYFTVISKMGRPDWDRSRAAADGLEYRLLRYSQRSLTIVLIGATASQSRYLGALGRNGRVVHSVNLPNGEDSTPLLEYLRPY